MFPLANHSTKVPFITQSSSLARSGGRLLYDISQWLQFVGIRSINIAHMVHLVKVTPLLSSHTFTALVLLV